MRPARCNRVTRACVKPRERFSPKSRDTFVCGLKGKPMIKNIFVAAAIAATAFGAQASANLVQNGALDGTVGTYIYNAAPSTVTQFYGAVPTTANTVADWTGSFVSIATSSGAWGTPSGLANFGTTTQGGYVAGVQADGTLSQSLTLAAGTYALSWLDANRSGLGEQSYSVSFGGVTYDTVTTLHSAGWTQESLVFTLAQDTVGALTFTGLTSYHDTDATSFIDNVSVSAVPEPTSLLMMAVATLGLLAWRRRAQV